SAAEPRAYLPKLPGEKAFMFMTGSNISVSRNSKAIVRTGGGGGWGDPLERVAAMVVEDVAEGVMSRQAARKLYGVILRGNMSLGDSETARLLDRLRWTRQGWFKRVQC